MSFKIGCNFCKEFFISKAELFKHWNLPCPQLCRCKRCNCFWRYSEIYDGKNYIIYFNLVNVHMPNAFFNAFDNSPPRKRRCFKKIHE